MPTQIFLLNDNVRDTKQAAATSLAAIGNAIDGLERVRDVFEVLQEIDENAEALEDIAKGLKNAMALVSKLGPPLSSVAPVLKRVLTSVEDRADAVANGIDVESKFGEFKDRIDALIRGMEPARDALEISVAELSAVETGIADAAVAVETAQSIPAELQNALTQANIIAGNLNAATSGITSLADTINALDARIDGVFGTFPAAVSALLGAARDFNDMIGKVDFLQTPMDILNDALEPVQWALDAAEAVIDAVINPVLDPIFDSLGVTDLFDKMAEAINGLIPELSLFNRIDADLARFSADFGDLTVDAPDLDIALESDLMARMRDDIGRLAVEVRKLITPFDPANLILDNAANLAIGYDGFDSRDPSGIIAGGTQIFAQEGDDLISGGLGGDVLNGGLGNDILIGGAGDDIIDGGGDTDGVILQGFLSEFSFKRDEVTDAIIVSHTHGAPGAVDLGTDVIRNVEYFMFKDRTLQISDFDFFYDAADGETEGDGISLTNVPAGPSRDFMFGTDGPESISSFALMDYITARGGNDTLNGGTGDDFLEGGAGSDSILGGPGIDVGSYLGEAGSPHFASLLPQADARQPFVSEDVYVGVEHLTGSDNTDWLWGSDATNRLDGRGGNDVLRGLGGHDSLIGGAGTDLMIGDGGNDTLIATAVDYEPTDPSTIGRKVMVAGTGNDVFITERGNFSSVWYGGVDFETTFREVPSLAAAGLSEADLAATLPDRIVVNGPVGRVQKFDATGRLTSIDTLVDAFRIFGSAGNDIFNSSGDQDFYFGGDGNDTFNGGPRNFRPLWDTSDPQNSFTVNDFYDGGAGDDLFRPAQGRTNIEAGSGDDTVAVSRQGWLLLNGSLRNDPDAADESDALDFSGSDLGWVVDLVGDYIGDPLKLGYSGVAEGHAPGTVDLPDETSYASYDSLQRQLSRGDGTFDLLLGESYLEIRDFEDVIGSAQDDFIAGNERANLLRGGVGNDVILGHAGDGTDTLSGEAGDDTLVGSAGSDRIFGGADNDDLRNAAGLGQAGGADRLEGGTGDDILRVFSGFQQVALIGGAGIDIADFSGFSSSVTLNLSQVDNGDIRILGVENLRGSAQADRLTGDGLGNNINGLGGDDLIDGGAGNDILFAGAGVDTLRGGANNDLLVVGMGGGTMDGGAGTDTASFGPNQTGDLSDGSADWQPEQTLGRAIVRLAEGQAFFDETATGTIHAYSLTDIENITGSLGADDLTGNGVGNRLSGDAGDDTLIGLGGDDVLSGGDGNDTLIDGGEGTAFRLNEGATRNQMLALNGYDDMPGNDYTVDLLFRSTEPSVALDSPFLSYAVPGTDNELLIYGSTGPNGFEIWVDGTRVITNVPIDDLFDNQEHRITLSVATIAGTVGRGERAGFTLHIDGELVHIHRAPPGSTMAGAQAGGSLVIGQEQDRVNGAFDTSQVLQGNISEVRVWDYAMGNAEIAERAFATIPDPGAVPGLVSHWTADPASGLMVDDLGGAPLSPTTTNGAGTPPQIPTLSGSGNDVMNGGIGADVIDGGIGHDTLAGGDGLDRVVGGTGNDHLFGDDIPEAERTEVSAQVYRIYQAALNRAPDVAGHQSWVVRLLEGDNTLRDVAAGFVASREFIATYGTDLSDDAFVELLYQNVLGRPSDAGGKQAWLDAMANGVSRAQVLLGFSESPEFRIRTASDTDAFSLSVSPQGWSDDVFRLYQATLDRVPDLGGFLFWTDQLGAGTPFAQVVEGFVRSREFTAVYGSELSDDAFVELLYQNVLGRPSDAGGKQGWLDAMQAGITRAEVVTGFAQSPEFVQATTADVKSWIRDQGRNDFLSGGDGMNTLTGGILSDSFVFDAAQGGAHRILDLEAWDTLVFTNFGYASEADALSHMMQVGDGVVFADQGVTITFDDAVLRMMADDMIFV